MRRRIGVNVYEAATQRIQWLFDRFDRVCACFSGGKDSTVLLHLAALEARRRGRRIGVLFIDWEAQFHLTIEHVERLFDVYADCVDPYWVTVPLRTTNACSQLQPEWTCWDPSCEDRWVRSRPEGALKPDDLPFYQPAMTFEEFFPGFSRWYSEGTPTAFLTGVRAVESLSRYSAVTRDKPGIDGRRWTTVEGRGNCRAHPIYDWRTRDIWVWHGKNPDCSYNRLYDLMHQAGLSIHQMRVCEPYGDEQRRGLWLYHVLEPQTWGKVAARVAGASTGALYARERGNVMGNVQIEKPEHLTWEQFAHFLLDTMPAATSEHYRNKIATWLRFYQEHGYPDGRVPDSLPADTGSKDMPSWRRVCKTLLKNDFWCKTLSFGPTKTSSYARYQALMRRRRDEWGLI